MTESCTRESTLDAKLSNSDSDKLPVCPADSKSNMMKLRRENAALQNKVREMMKKVNGINPNKEDAHNSHSAATSVQGISPWFFPFTTMEDITNFEHEWSMKLSSVSTKKNKEIEQISNKIRSRDNAIESLECTAKFQVATIQELSEQVDEQTRELHRIQAAMSQKESLFKLQNERLKDNSATISNMLRTITKQNEEMSNLRSELKKLEHELCSSDRSLTPLGKDFSESDVRAARILDAWHREQSRTNKARAA